MPDKFSGDIDRRGGFLDYLVIILITIILVTFVVWANFTKLDLVTTGSGIMSYAGTHTCIIWRWRDFSAWASVLGR